MLVWRRPDGLIDGRVGGVAVVVQTKMDTSALLPVLNMVVMMAMTDRASTHHMALTVVAMLLPQALPTLVAWLQAWWRGEDDTYSLSVNSEVANDVFRAVSRMARQHIRCESSSMVVGSSRKHMDVKRSMVHNKYGYTRYTLVPVLCPTGRFRCVWKGLAIRGQLSVEQKDKLIIMDLRLSVPAAAKPVLDDFVETATLEAWREQNLKKGATSGQVAFSLRFRDKHLQWRPAFLAVAKTFDTLWLAPPLHAAIVGDLDTFMASADFYRRRGMPHKRGMLFHGPPGTGKTSCIYAIAHKLGYDVYRVSVRQCTPEQLQSALQKVKGAGVIVVEEVDLQLAQESYDFPGATKADGRGAETTDKCKLAVLMEYLDGYVTHSPGTLVIFTTNHKEDIPPPLIRPGRIDRHFLFPPLSGADVTRVARQFTGIPDLECPDVTIPAADLINAVLLPHIGDEEALRAAVAALRDE